MYVYADFVFATVINALCNIKRFIRKKYNTLIILYT